MSGITIKEIAKKAGVSIGTVDRVLHDRGGVSKRTAELVERIAREGKYRANVIARGLRMKKDNRIAILLPDDNEYWRTINRGIINEANEVAGIGMSVSSFVYDRHEANSFMEQAGSMLATSPDGVIMAPILAEGSMEICMKLQGSGIPYLFVDSTLTTADPLTFIGQDSMRAGCLAAHLLTLGYPRGCPVYIALIHDFDSMNKTIDERIEGLKKYVEENRMDECMIHEIGLNRNFNALVEEAEALARNGSPMHIFVPNSRANEVGTALSTVRGQFRIVGFDLVEKNRTALRDGLIDLIIDQSPALQGAESVRTFYKLTITREPVVDIMMPLTIYTRENI